MAPNRLAKSPLEIHTEQVASLIFVADRSVAIMHAGGESADAINDAGLGDLFTSLHGALVDNAFLTVAKIFERPRGYRLWSLPALLSEIAATADSLPVADRSQGLALLKELDSDALVSPAMDDATLISTLVQVLQLQLPAAAATEPRPHDLALDALRQQRDKVIAHSEGIDHGTLLSASWQDLDGLLALAKRQIGIIGWVLFRTAYMTDDGWYPLADDAARTGMAMRRLLTKAGLRPPRPFAPMSALTAAESSNSP